LYDTSAILKRQFDMSKPAEVPNATNQTQLNEIQTKLDEGNLEDAASRLRTLPLQNNADYVGKQKMSVEYLRKWVDENAGARGFFNKILTFFGLGGATGDQALDTFKSITAVGPNETRITDPRAVNQAVRFRIDGSLLEFSSKELDTQGGTVALNIIRQLAADQLALNRRGQ